MAALAAVVAALLAFGVSERPAAAQSEPQTVGKVTNLTATAAGQTPGSVRLTWNAADNAQVYFVYYIEQKDLDARNWAAGRMRAFNGTEAIIDGLAGGETYHFAASGMRWHFGTFKPLWGGWDYWETAAPAGSATSPVPTAAQSEPGAVGAVTGLTTTAESQQPGAVHLTWNAAENAQVYFVYYIDEKQRNASNWSAGQMRAFNGTEATIDGLVGGETYYFAASGMRWHFGRFEPLWGGWDYWETATPNVTTPSIPFSDLEHAAWLEQNKPALANQLKALPWVADGVDESEREAAEELIRAARWYPDVFNALMAMPWVQDDSITTAETRAIDGIRGSAYYSPLLSERMLQKPWVQDDITRDEAEIIRRLYWLSARKDETTQQKMVDVGISIIGMPFLDSVENRDTLALRSLAYIAARDASDFRNLMAHPRIKDGITDEETKIVAVLGGRTYSYAPGSAEVLLTGTNVYIQERLIQLPHTGETLLAVIGVQDPDPRSMEWFEHAVRTIERFMGEPFPINYLALLYYDNESYNANNNFTHIFFMGEDYSISRASHPAVIAHEAAHWYWSGDSEGYQYRKWITEGSADFFKIISEHERVGRPLKPIGRPCSFFDSISELEKANPSREFIPGVDQPLSCYYSLGNRFFLDLYLALGDETFRRAFRTLYLRSQQDNFTDGCGRPPFNICRVEAAFKDGASPEVVAKVDAVIAHWYYGKTVTHEGDRAELTALYHATGGANWADNTNWLSDAHIGEWYGVTTDAYGRVTELDLAENGLSGPLPSGLGNLLKLERLDLNDNQLTGAIPVSLGNLTNLTRLHLRNSQFTGAIPSNLGNLRGLTGLNLGGNRLSGAIPPELGNLTNLTSLSLSGNGKLSGPIPTWLGRFSQIRGLYLWGNQFTGAVPSELGNLTNLTRLSMGNNELSGAIPASLGNLSNLEGLYLHNNRLEGEIPAQLGNLSKLTDVFLSGNQLSGCIPAALLAVEDNDLDRVNLSTCQ